LLKCIFPSPNADFFWVAYKVLATLSDDKGNPKAIDDPAPESGQTPLMASVLMGHTDIVSLLLGAGADPSVGEMQGYTPVHGAGFQGRREVFKVLLDAGLDVQDVHEDGFQPIHRACWGSERRHFETVKWLVEEAGVDPEVKAVDGSTCFTSTRNSKTKQFLEKLRKQREGETSDEL
jgi:Ankyrin repeats (3 copies)/Ankyrin repeat